MQLRRNAPMVDTKRNVQPPECQQVGGDQCADLSDDRIRPGCLCSFFELDVEKDYQLYGWYHWLILEHGINRCRKTPVCDPCVFENVCKNTDCSNDKTN